MQLFFFVVEFITWLKRNKNTLVARQLSSQHNKCLTSCLGYICVCQARLVMSHGNGLFRLWCRLCGTSFTISLHLYLFACQLHIYSVAMQVCSDVAQNMLLLSFSKTTQNNLSFLEG